MPAPQFSRPIRGTAPDQYVSSEADVAALNAVFHKLWLAIASNAPEDVISELVEQLTVLRDETQEAAATFAISPKNYGAVADLTFTGIDDPLGPVRTGGTNDLPAFIAADAAAVAAGSEVVVPPGQYFLDGGFSPKARWRAKIWGSVIIWTRYGVVESGIWIPDGDTAEWVGFRMIGQYDRQGIPKPNNAGHLGNIVTLGKFVTPDSQKPVRARVEVLMVRARNTDEQPSTGAFLCNGIGYVFGTEWRIGVWGAGSNAPSVGMIQHHWGALADMPGWDLSQDPTNFPYIESYHPENCTIGFLGGEIDAAAHNIQQIAVRSATIGVHIGACASTGAARPIYDLAGDENDRIAIPQQRGRVGRGNTQGVQNHRNCNPAALGSSESVLMFSRGTSKSAFAAGGTQPLMQQYPNQAIGQGLILGAASGSQIIRGLFIDRQADFSPGPMWLTASGPVEKSVFWQQSSGGELDIRDTNRPVHVRQGYLDSLKLRVDMGPEQEILPRTIFQQGFGSGGAGLVVESTVRTEALSHNLNFGDTVLRVVPFPFSTQRGTRLFVNGNPVVMREFYTSNSTEIEIEPSPYEASAGDPVRIEMHAGIGELEAEIISSERGIMLRGATVGSANISRMSGQGRNAVVLETHDEGFGPDSIPSRMKIRGGSLPIIGRLGSQFGDAECFTVRVRPKCHVDVESMKIPHNPHVAAHFQLARQVVEGVPVAWGTADFRGCIIENISALIAATTPSLQANVEGCFDYSGAPVQLPLYSETRLPELLIDGSPEGIEYSSRFGTLFYSKGGLFDWNFDFTLSNKSARSGGLTMLSPAGLVSPISLSQPIFMTNYSIPAGAPFILGGTGGTLFLSRQTTSGVATLNDTQITDTTRVRGWLRFKA